MFGVATEATKKPPSLEELWESMPPLPDIRSVLEEWDIWEDSLTVEGA